jgi:hypothetical protein
MKSTLPFLAAASCALALVLPTHADTRVSVDLGLRLGPPVPVAVRYAPPSPRFERRMAAPGRGYFWIGGHHAWMTNQWVWVPGIWALPPQPGALWVEGRWDNRSRNWIDGYWSIPAPPPPPAQVVIVEAPPPPRQEVIIMRPSPLHVWIDGYWIWRGRRHEWVAGHWELPPRGRGTWVAPRWDHRGKSYVFIEGTWR